jgi:energy-coupling factor transporter transmembrane protein EcfT
VLEVESKIKPWVLPVVILIFVQALIIGAGLYYRWDWIAVQFAVLEIASGLVVLVFGLRDGIARFKAVD